jgi:hypothetical protein
MGREYSVQHSALQLGSLILLYQVFVYMWNKRRAHLACVVNMLVVAVAVGRAEYPAGDSVSRPSNASTNYLRANDWLTSHQDQSIN